MAGEERCGCTEETAWRWVEDFLDWALRSKADAPRRVLAHAIEHWCRVRARNAAA